MTIMTKLSKNQQKEIEQKLGEMFTLHCKRYPEYLPFAKQGIKYIVALASDDHLGVLDVVLLLIGVNGDILKILFDGWYAVVDVDVIKASDESSNATNVRNIANKPMSLGDSDVFRHAMHCVPEPKWYQ